MLFTQKVETVGGIKDFLAQSPAKRKMVGSLIAGAGIGTLATLIPHTQQAVPAMAMPMPALGLMNMTDMITKAVDPLIQLVQGLSYPVGFIMICAGALVIMTGNKQKGLHMIKWAAIGYILMQFAPGIMHILIQVGVAMKGAH
jgi:formate/nitrite transporter FocA (FNT family)